MRPQSKGRDLTLLVLSGQGERVHSLKFSRTRLWLLLGAWLCVLAGAAALGFHYWGDEQAQGASGAVALSAEARQK